MNPNVELSVVWAFTWFDPAKEADAAKALIDQGVDVIAAHTDLTAPLAEAAKTPGRDRLWSGPRTWDPRQFAGPGQSCFS